MSSSVFFRTVVCGFIATFVMAMVAFLQGSIGLPVIDVGHILTESFNHVHASEPYHIIFGNLAFNIIGVGLALIWVVYLQKRIPGNWLIQGIIFGVIISIIGGLVVSPVVSQAAGESFGIFYSETWIPGKLIIAGLLMHIVYGTVLTQSLKIAGVDGVNG
ncbi:MAG: hypothetical protein CL666_02090 [Balneola sp.]|nr:hypothetical protein [Balneola sp.]|tara:strand:- start:100193 stop:100672 length:480 start_codon:yes stop_codon:yes gene_type:complete